MRGDARLVLAGVGRRGFSLGAVLAVVPCLIADRRFFFIEVGIYCCVCIFFVAVFLMCRLGNDKQSIGNPAARTMTRDGITVSLIYIIVNLAEECQFIAFPSHGIVCIVAIEPAFKSAFLLGLFREHARHLHADPELVIIISLIQELDYTPLCYVGIVIFFIIRRFRYIVRNFAIHIMKLAIDVHTATVATFRPVINDPTIFFSEHIDNTFITDEHAAAVALIAASFPHRVLLDDRVIDYMEGRGRTDIYTAAVAIFRNVGSDSAVVEHSNLAAAIDTNTAAVARMYSVTSDSNVFVYYYTAVAIDTNTAAVARMHSVTRDSDVCHIETAAVHIDTAAVASLHSVTGYSAACYIYFVAAVQIDTAAVAGLHSVTGYSAACYIYFVAAVQIDTAAIASLHSVFLNSAALHLKFAAAIDTNTAAVAVLHSVVVDTAAFHSERAAFHIDAASVAGDSAAV